ncbi:MAG: cupin domain-containing protein [Candidatus Nitrosopumilus sp. Bin_571-38]
MTLKLEYDLDTYLEKLKNNNSYFETFINKDSLAAGVLVLKPGEEDTQTPHDSDEVYYVISGDGFLKIKNKNYKVSKDKLFFVAKDVEHFFHGNTKELKVLYFFGGPDS